MMKRLQLAAALALSCTLCVAMPKSFAKKRQTSNPAKPALVVSASNELRRSSAFVTLVAGVEKLLAKEFRFGVTAFVVADANSGDELLSQNADLAMNPASNVKMIATAAALEALGPTFQFKTELLGPLAVGRQASIAGDVFLIGSHDPTFDSQASQELIASLAQRGIVRIDGNVWVGDIARDTWTWLGLPLQITGTTRGKPPTVALWERETDTEVVNRAKTIKSGKTSIALSQKPLGNGRYRITITGRIVAGESATRLVSAANRPDIRLRWLRWQFEQAGIAITGNVGQKPLREYVQANSGASKLTVPLASKLSPPVAELIAKVNKRSINWLADRLVNSAAAHSLHTFAGRDSGVLLMQRWLKKFANIASDQYFLDTGSGLSYKTKLTVRQVLATTRVAAGFSGEAQAAAIWRRSLAIGGKDGTLAHRFVEPMFTDRVLAKTGTLSNVVALSGMLLVNRDRPLLFSIVTNKHSPGYKLRMRRAQQEFVGLLTRFVADHDGVPLVPKSAPPSVVTSPTGSEDTSDPDPQDLHEQEPK